MYGKFFASTFTGSMVGAGAHVFAVWGYVIANTRPDGYVELNPPILAAMIGCSVEEVESAILYLTSPDTRSRSKQHNGSRLIQEAPFLYLVPNYPDYRSIRDENDRREYMKNYMREYRAKDSVNVNVNSGKPPLAHTEAEAEAEAEAEEQSTSKKKKASRLPSDFIATEELLGWAKVKRPTIDTSLETEKFINYWTAKSGKDATKLDWNATWRNWILNAKETSNGSYYQNREQNAINERNAINQLREAVKEVSGDDAHHSTRQLRGFSEDGYDG